MKLAQLASESGIFLGLTFQRKAKKDCPLTLAQALQKPFHVMPATYP